MICIFLKKFYGAQIKEDEMGKLVRGSPFGRPRCKRKKNIKTDVLIYWGMRLTEFGSG